MKNFNIFAWFLQVLRHLFPGTLLVPDVCSLHELPQVYHCNLFTTMHLSKAIFL